MSTSDESTFRVGDRVKVKPDVTDVMSSNIALGGWAGVVGQVDEDKVQVLWDEATLSRMPSAHRKHWESDALPTDSLWLPRQALIPM